VIDSRYLINRCSRSSAGETRPERTVRIARSRGFGPRPYPSNFPWNRVRHVLPIRPIVDSPLGSACVHPSSVNAFDFVFAFGIDWKRPVEFAPCSVGAAPMRDDGQHKQNLGKEIRNLPWGLVADAVGAAETRTPLSVICCSVLLQIKAKTS